MHDHRDLSAPTILLIDDDRDVLSGLSTILNAAGYNCHGLSDPASAGELASQIHPDLIISDINLAGTSGISLCEQIKHQSGLENVPLMFLSGAQVPDIIRRSHSAGGVYYLRKPLDPAVFLELIDKALRACHLAGPQLAST